MEADARAIGLYVHVPFCRSKCRYCDFASRPPAPGEVEAWRRALEIEIGLRADARPAATLYFGGGTPSFVGIEALRSVIAALRRGFALLPDCEVTVEANPCDVTPDWLRACREAGVNRLSLGVQSLRDEDLRFLERGHTGEQAAAAGRLARAAGFDNLGVDLIIGLPGHGAALTREVIHRAVERFAPEHLSCYQLTCAAQTRLGAAVARGEVVMPDAETEAGVFLAAHAACAEAGYEGYEVSNFAQSPARRSRHNLGYWRRRDCIGLGPSAHSLLGARRAWNVADPARYAARLACGEGSVEGEECLTPRQEAAEVVLLGLRMREGFSLDALRRYGVDLDREKPAELTAAESRGLIRREGGRIVPTLRGMAVADRLAVELAPEMG